MIAKIALFTVFLVGANSFYLNQEYNRPTALEDLEQFYLEQPFEYVQPVYVRERRQLHGVVNNNPDGTTNIMAKLPLVGNDKNVLSAVAALDSIKPNGDIGARTAGLTLENVKGHAFSLTDKKIPNFGEQITAAAKVNLVNTAQHDLSANAFAASSLPNPPPLPTLPKIPNFNTYGGGVDYMFDKKIGASVGVSHTPEFQKTDYSALGKLNLFRDRSSSLDFSAGASKSVSPFIPSSSWQPNIGFSLSKYF